MVFQFDFKMHVKVSPPTVTKVGLFYKRVFLYCIQSQNLYSLLSDPICHFPSYMYCKYLIFALNKYCLNQNLKLEDFLVY